jgi:hypothetical protein
VRVALKRQLAGAGVNSDDPVGTPVPLALIEEDVARTEALRRRDAETVAAPDEGRHAPAQGAEAEAVPFPQVIPADSREDFHTQHGTIR